MISRNLKLLFLILLLHNSLCAEFFENPDIDPRNKRFEYNELAVYPVTFHHRYISVIQFPQEEFITERVIGDKSSWKLIVSRNKMYIQPIELGVKTNMRIVTNQGREYTFDIYSAKEDYLSDDVDIAYSVGFVYDWSKKSDGSLIEIEDFILEKEEESAENLKFNNDEKSYKNEFVDDGEEYQKNTINDKKNENLNEKRQNFDESSVENFDDKTREFHEKEQDLEKKQENFDYKTREFHEKEQDLEKKQENLNEKMHNLEKKQENLNDKRQDLDQENDFYHEKEEESAENLNILELIENIKKNSLINENYNFSGNSKAKPKDVFDDGKLVYIVFESENEIPQSIKYVNRRGKFVEMDAMQNRNVLILSQIKNQIILYYSEKEQLTLNRY